MYGSVERVARLLVIPQPPVTNGVLFSPVMGGLFYPSFVCRAHLTRHGVNMCAPLNSMVAIFILMGQYSQLLSTSMVLLMARSDGCTICYQDLIWCTQIGV